MAEAIAQGVACFCRPSLRQIKNIHPWPGRFCLYRAVPFLLSPDQTVPVAGGRTPRHFGSRQQKEAASVWAASFISVRLCSGLGAATGRRGSPGALARFDKVDEPLCRSGAVVGYRKLDPKRGTAVITIFCPYPSLVRLDNGARDGQTHSHASRLVGVKRFKDRF
jgi:hypothetical protein